MARSAREAHPSDALLTEDGFRVGGWKVSRLSPAEIVPAAELQTAAFFQGGSVDAVNQFQQFLMRGARPQAPSRQPAPNSQHSDERLTAPQASRWGR